MKEDDNAMRETALHLWKLLWDVFTFRSFAFAQGYLFFLSCPERLVQGFFFWEVTV